MSEFRTFDDPKTKALEMKLEYYTSLMENCEKIKGNKYVFKSDPIVKTSVPKISICHPSQFRKPAQNMYKVVRNHSLNVNVESKHSCYSSKHIASNFPSTSRVMQNQSINSNKFFPENRSKVSDNQFRNTSRPLVSYKLRKHIPSSVAKVSFKEKEHEPLDINTRNKTGFYNSNVNCKGITNVMEENKRTVFMKDLSVNSRKSIKTTSKELVNEIEALTEQLKKRSENLNKHSVSNCKLNCEVLNNFRVKDNIPKAKLLNSNSLSVDELAKEYSLKKEPNFLSKIPESNLKNLTIVGIVKNNEIESQVKIEPAMFTSSKNMAAVPEKKSKKGSITCLQETNKNSFRNNCSKIASTCSLDVSHTENILSNSNACIEEDLNSGISMKSNLKSPKIEVKLTTPVSSIIMPKKLHSSNKKKLISEKKLHSSKYKVINKKLQLNKHDGSMKLCTDAKIQKIVKLATPVSSFTAKRFSYNSKKKIVKRKSLTSKYKVVNERLSSPNKDHFYKNSSDNEICPDQNVDVICDSVSNNLSNVQKKLFTTQNKKLLNSKYKVVNNMLITNRLKNNSFSKCGAKKIKSVKLAKRKQSSVYKLVNMKATRDIVRQKHFSPLKLCKSLNSFHKINNSVKKSLYQVKNKTPKITRKDVAKTSSKKSSVLNSQYKFINKSCVENDILKSSKICSQSKLMNFYKRSQKNIFPYCITNKDAIRVRSKLYSCSYSQNLLMKRVFKSRSTIINKNNSPISQTARMIKTKYFMLNRRSFPSHKYSASSKEFQRNRSFKGLTQYNKHHYLCKEKDFSKKHCGVFSHKSARLRCNMNMFNQKKRYSFSCQNPVLIIRGQKFASGASGKTLKRLSSKSPVLVIRGQGFVIGSSGKTLKRLSPKSSAPGTQVPKRIFIGGKTFVRTTTNVMKVSSPVSKTLASRVLNRSISRALTASVKKKMSKINTYCMFYNRFGRCNKGIKCPYIHDPSKIAVCTRFLRGTCKIDGCPFSHEICPGKMAICSFFLLGSCNKINCPYRHENLSPDVELCKAFVQGYCSEGKQCKKAHILVCPQYVQGICEKGDACAFPHPPPKVKKNNLKDNTIKKQSEKESEELLLESVTRYFLPSTNGNISLHESYANVVMPRMQKLPKQPSFIPLSSTPVATRSVNFTELPSFSSNEGTTS